MGMHAARCHMRPCRAGYLKTWPVCIFKDFPFSLYIVAASESNEGLVLGYLVFKVKLDLFLDRTCRAICGYMFTHFKSGGVETHKGRIQNKKYPKTSLAVAGAFSPSQHHTAWNTSPPVQSKMANGVWK